MTCNMVFVNVRSPNSHDAPSNQTIATNRPRHGKLTHLTLQQFLRDDNLPDFLCASRDFHHFGGAI